MATSQSPWEPEGPFVSSAPATAPVDSPSNTLTGNHVTLVPLLPSHAPSLFTNLGGMHNAHLYKYVSSGPFTDLESFKGLITSLSTNLTTLFPYAILSSDPIHLSNQQQPSADGHPTAIGIITLLNIVPAHRSIEIGHVLFCPTLQRTTASTETYYLLMQHAFNLHYLRVEWKCNTFNEPSRKAALRLGFVFEGVFRKHMVVKGRSRDSAWFSITDEEWEGRVGKALEEWLGESNFVGGKQVRRLEEVREEVVSRTK